MTENNETRSEDGSIETVLSSIRRILKEGKTSQPDAVPETKTAEAATPAPQPVHDSLPALIPAPPVEDLDDDDDSVLVLDSSMLATDEDDDEDPYDEHEEAPSGPGTVATEAPPAPAEPATPPHPDPAQAEPPVAAQPPQEVAPQAAEPAIAVPAAVAEEAPAAPVIAEPVVSAPPPVPAAPPEPAAEAARHAGAVENVPSPIQESEQTTEAPAKKQWSFPKARPGVTMSEDRDASETHTGYTAGTAPSDADAPAPVQIPLDKQTIGATEHSFGALQQMLRRKQSVEHRERRVAITRGGNLTIEDIVRDEVRAFLKEWLDQHLSSIVQQAVQKEIERLSDR